MSKSFFVVDKLNVVAKECFPLVRFNYDNSDYLIYYSASDNNNCDIFISKLLRNNGKYIFDNVDSLEIFSSLVRDILELPASYTKDLNIEQLFNDFSDNHNIEFVARFPILSDQEGYNISNLMNIDMEYIKYVNYFYSNALPKLKKRAYVDKPVDIISDSVQNKDSVWSIPTSSNENVQNDKYNDMPAINNDSSSDIMENSSSINNSFFTSASYDNQVYNTNDYANFSMSGTNQSVSNSFNGVQKNVGHSNNLNIQNSNFVNPNYSYYGNVDVNAYNSGDLVNNSTQNNMPLANQNAGYASSKYIIIGTICLILASLIVAASIVIVNRL